MKAAPLHVSLYSLCNYQSENMWVCMPATIIQMLFDYNYKTSTCALSKVILSFVQRVKIAPWLGCAHVSLYIQSQPLRKRNSRKERGNLQILSICRATLHFLLPGKQEEPLVFSCCIYTTTRVTTRKLSNFTLTCKNFCYNMHVATSESK